MDWQDYEGEARDAMQSLMTARVSAEQTFDDMVLLCSNEYSQAMAPAIEYTSKALEYHAKEKTRQRHSRPEFVTNCMSFASRMPR